MASVAALASFALAGCGGGGGGGGDKNKITGSRNNSVSVGTFPVTIDHAYGSTTIEERPTKIVTLGLSDQDPLLALGVKPAAVYPWYGDYKYQIWPWAQDELGDAKPVVLNKGVRDEANPPIDEIASLRPDLILSLYNGTTKAQYAKLSKIAPTVVPTKQYANFAITWQEATRVTGKVLGREAEAVALVRGLERKFATAAAANPQFKAKRVVVAERFEPGESVVRVGNDVRAQFFLQLGFRLPTEIAGKKPDEFGEIKVSDELITSLSRDLLVWNVGFDAKARGQVEKVALYKTLPVVQRNKVLWVEDPVVSGAFSWGTVLSLEYALDKLLPQIKQAVR